MTDNPFDNVKTKDPEPFEFEFILKDKSGQEFCAIVSGFDNTELQEIEELTILDEFKNDITNLHNDRETVNDIREAITLGL